MATKKLSIRRAAKHKSDKKGSKGKMTRGAIIKKVLGIMLVFFGLMILVGGIGVAALVVKYSKELPPAGQPLQRNAPETTQILDRNGKVLYNLHGSQNREWVKLTNISPQMKWAMISAEDANFYNEQIGIDPIAIARAVVYDVLHRGSGSLQGASTIPQELVKNTVLTDQQTYGRKIEEIILTLQLSRTYSKDQILEAYLNEIPWGGDVYGIKTASETYFGVEPDQLDLAQSAMLAGIVQAPSYYSPIFGTNPDSAIARQHYVLEQMLKHSDETHVTAQQVQAAEKEQLHYQGLQEDILAPHFVNYVIQALDQKYGSNYAETQGLKVYTTLDYNMQQLAQQAVTNSVDYFVAHRLNGHNGALVTIDATNGEIMSMVGSYKYGANLGPTMEGDTNVTLLPRQPGSSIKPLLYMTAFQQLGMNPATLMPDLPIDINGYKPTNFDLSYQGPESIRVALDGSRNVPAVKTLYAVGTSAFISMLDKLGYTGMDAYANDLSIAIGSAGVPLLEHTDAYTVFANDGVQYNAVSILKIVDRQGKVVYQYDPSKAGQNVVDPKYPYMITSILENYHTLSVNPSTKAAGMHFGVKTGTTNGARDAIMIGYSPKFVTGMWVGNSDNSIMTPVSYGEYLAPFWNKYMIQINEPYKSMDFTKPAGIVTETVCADDGLLAKPTDACKKATDIFASNQLPKYDDENIAVKVCNENQNELATQDQINNNDYTTKLYIQLKEWSSIFQPALDAWEQSKGYPYTAPPTQYCNGGSGNSGNGMGVSVSPSANNLQPGQQIQISLTNTNGNITQVGYKLDGQDIGSSNTAPFQVSYTLPSSIPSGSHELVATATDTSGNDTSLSTTLTINGSNNNNGSLSLISPVDGQQIPSSQQIQFHATYSGDMSKVTNEFFRVSGGICDTQASKCIVPVKSTSADFSTSEPAALFLSGSHVVTAVVMVGSNEIDSNNVNITVTQ